MRKLLIAGMLCAALAPTVAQAQATDPQNRAEELARESLNTLMRALDAMLDAVPQYGLPEIMENGDIIIRRIRPDDDQDMDKKNPEEPEMDQT